MDDVHGQRSGGRKVDVANSARTCLKNVENALRYRKSDGRPSRDLQKQIDELVFGIADNKGNVTGKEGGIQQLELLEVLCLFFMDKPLADAKLRYMVFETIFFGRESESKLHECRMNIFVQVLSLAVVMPCVPLLVDTSTWMQKAVNTKGAAATVKSISARLVDDFCRCDGDDHGASKQKTLCELISLCPSFVLYFLVYAMSNYDWFVMPPLPLLEIAAEWMCSNCKLFLRPFRDLSKTISVGPMVRMLSQCIGKLCCVCIMFPIVEASGAHTQTTTSDDFICKLRFAILQIMLLVPKVNVDSCGLLMGKNVSKALKRINEAKHQNSDDVNSALDTLSQFMEVAMASKCFFGNRKDFDVAMCNELAYGHPLFSHVFNTLIS